MKIEVNELLNKKPVGSFARFQQAKEGCMLYT